MEEKFIENITTIIKNSSEMLIVGFVDENSVVDNLISEKIKLIANTLNFKLEIYEFDVGLIENNYNYFNLVSVPTYNVYYNNVLVEQLDLIDTRYDLKTKLSHLIIN